MKLQTNKEQLSLTRKQCENAEDATLQLEGKITEIMSQLDASRSQCLQLNQEKDILQKNLDSIRSEKNALDRNRLEITNMVRVCFIIVQYNNKLHIIFIFFHISDGNVEFRL